MTNWEREPLTPHEVDLVLDVLRNEEETTAILALVDTGIRANEVLRIQSTWCYWRKGKYGTLHVPINDNYTPSLGTRGRGPKTKRDRNIPITSRLHDALHAWFRAGNTGFYYDPSRPDDIKFANTVKERNRRYMRFYNLCIRAGEDAGLYTSRTRRGKGTVYTVKKGIDHSKGWHVTPHGLRHTYATDIYYHADLKTQEIGKLMGHVGGGVVESTYLHLDEKRIAEKIAESGWLD